jgi:hypothetical protein
MKRTVEYLIALMVVGIGLSGPLSAQQGSGSKSDEIDPDALKALNKMGAYLRTLKDFQVEAAVTSEDVLTDGEKLQYGHTSNILASLPDKMRIEVDGELNSRLFLYDGKSFTLYARRAGFYATVAAPPTVVELADVLDKKYDIQVPLADLFLWGGPHAVTNEITVASDIGEGEIGGVSCEHYAFRQPGLDWQVWIQLGSHPLPRKLVLTTTTDEARPQHTSVLTWNLAPSFNDAAFTFDPPPDAHKIVFAESKEK